MPFWESIAFKRLIVSAARCALGSVTRPASVRESAFILTPFLFARTFVANSSRASSWFAKPDYRSNGNDTKERQHCDLGHQKWRLGLGRRLGIEPRHFLEQLD